MNKPCQNVRKSVVKVRKGDDVGFKFQPEELEGRIKCQLGCLGVSLERLFFGEL